MRKINALIAVVVLVLAAWSGWWWFGASQKADAVERWLAERREDGWAADAEVSVIGYPSRFDMTVEGLTLADPEGGWAWSAPVFRTYMLAWQPNRIIAEWPGVHVVSVPGETAEASAEAFRASAAFLPTTALAIDRAVVETEGLTLSGESGWSAGLGTAQLSVRRSESLSETPNAYDAVFDARDIAPTEALRETLTRALGGALPDRINRLSLDLTAVLRRPLDRHAVEESDIRPEALELRRSLIRWGPLGLEAEGRLEVAPDGVPTGRIDLTARNWRAMLSAAERSGAIAPGLATTMRAGLEVLSLLSSDAETLSAPLVFAEGVVSLGPVPLGEAPRF
jgi:hypothetical protein